MFNFNLYFLKLPMITVKRLLGSHCKVLNS